MTEKTMTIGADGLTAAERGTDEPYVTAPAHMKAPVTRLTELVRISRIAHDKIKVRVDYNCDEVESRIGTLVYTLHDDGSGNARGEVIETDSGHTKALEAYWDRQQDEFKEIRDAIESAEEQGYRICDPRIRW